MWSAIGKFILKQTIWFIAKTLWALISDEKMQTLALKAVENAADTDLNDDGKRKHAVEKLQKEAMERGKEIGLNEANALVETALLKAKELGKVEDG